MSTATGQDPPIDGIEPIALAVAFAGGVVSFLSPCVLALVPGYLAFVSGVAVDRLDERPRAVLGPALAFVASFSVLFTLLGASLGGVSELLRVERRPLEWVGGSLLVLFGLITVLGPRLGVAQGSRRPLSRLAARRGGLGGAALTGLAFGIGWTPCIGPVLGSILTFAATGRSAWAGALLLFTYSLGMAVPFIATSLGARQAMRAFGRARRVVPTLTWVGAVGMVAMGVLVASGQMQVITSQMSRFNSFG